MAKFLELFNALLRYILSRCICSERREMRGQCDARQVFFDWQSSPHIEAVDYPLWLDVHPKAACITLAIRPFTDCVIAGKVHLSGT